MRDGGDKKSQGAALPRYSQRTADMAARFCFCPSLFHFRQSYQKWDFSCRSIWVFFFSLLFSHGKTLAEDDIILPSRLSGCETVRLMSIKVSLPKTWLFFHQWLCVAVTDMYSRHKKTSPLNDWIISFQRHLTFNLLQFLCKDNQCLWSPFTSPHVSRQQVKTWKTWLLN